jgi:S-DNA-T family DNA segregation ATPase FtsK/SpoIIIE
MLGRPVDVWSDNHYFVRYVIDLLGLTKGDTFESGELADHIDRAEAFAVPLGFDTRGELRWLDMVRGGRHLLLTGTTGGGKSTWMDTAICTLVRNVGPEQLQMAFLDAQKLNFSPYQVLTEYHFTDQEGRLGVAWRPDDIVAALARLDREHLQRVELIGDTPWGNIEDYNAHTDPEDRLPYVFVFTDELMVLRAQMSRAQGRAFDRHLLSLIVGARKVGFRIALCLQYVKGTFLTPEIAAQAALQLAFWNSPQGSKNSIGDTAATMLPGQGRFIVEGLPGGRQVLQGLYVDRETVLALLDFRHRRVTYDVDTLVLDIISFAIQELDGRLSRDTLMDAFGHLMSRRQMDGLLDALERIGLALPTDRSQVPPLPRRLRVGSVKEAVEVLQYHPEVSFREDRAAGGLVFGP